MKKDHQRSVGVFALWMSCVSATAWGAVDSQWIDQKLEEFHINPEKFMTSQEPVSKYDPMTGRLLDGVSQFSSESIRNRDFVVQKNAQQRWAEQRTGGRAPIQPNDRPENLVDQFQYRTLQEIERAGLMSAQLPDSPWSDDYWAIYTGGVAKRYSDPRFPASQDWMTNRNYLYSHSSSIDLMSPAEKYDLLVGDPNFTLTRAAIEQGAQYYRSTGSVAPWMGICHGWAPAAIMFSRPSRAVDMVAADGRKIPFYPSDIKALASLLWAQAAPPSRTIGARCNDKNPVTDGNGRVLSPNCFDTNPGSWHLSIVNQIGGSRRGFVMDATFDFEVWNQPVYSYEYSYFNPITRRAVDSLDKAVVQRAQFTQDKFAAYRSRNAAYLVGVAMKVVYVAETSPSHAAADSSAQDRLVAVNYLYDLELDRNFQVLGGEWYTQKHPDFLWVPAQNSRAISVGDRYLERPDFAAYQWQGTESFPRAWTAVAQHASQSMQPLARVVNTLLSLSR